MLAHKVHNLIFKWRRWILPITVGIFAITLFAVSPASAQVLDTNGVMNALLGGVSKMILALAKVCMGLTLFALKFFIELARYNGYIDAPPVIIGWIMVRDVANMFFVVVLLAIAFGTILGLEQYEWKKTLVKMIFAAIFINFSKLIAQVIIDVGHVFTMTFLNAVTATAGGNLINIFNFQGMLKILSQDPSLAGNTDLRVDIFAASVLALVFASLAMMTIGAYLVVMALRVVVLWVLIILAPLAYILGVIPNTKSYADEYWGTFTKHVMVAPIMVFFLWLSFATLGNGNIASQINLNMGTQTLADTASGIRATQVAAANPSASILEVTTWENMANFIIAIAFLLVGIAMVERLGVKGGHLVSGAVTFAKNVATIASGVALARWAVGTGTKAGKGALGLAAAGVYHGTPLSSWVKRTKNWGEMQWNSFQAWRHMPQGKKMRAEKTIDEDGNVRYVAARYEADDDQGHKKGDIIFDDIKIGAVQKFFQRGVLKDIASAKRLEKTKNFLETRKEILDKDTRGIPSGKFMKDWEQIDATDRYERGRLKRKQARSAAKTEEYEALGEVAESGTKRKQYDNGKWTEKSEILQDEVAAHEIRAAQNKGRLHAAETKAKVDVVVTGKNKDTMQQVLYNTVAAERAAHLSGLQFDRATKEQAKAFAGSKEGIHETKEENVTEKAIKAADDFVARIKDKDLRDAFHDARNTLEEIIVRNKENPKKIAAEVQALVAKETPQAAYMSALLEAQKLEQMSEEKSVSEKKAIDNMNDAIISIPQGSRSPSTALSDALKRAGDVMGGMERVQAQKTAADRIATLMARKKELSQTGDTLSLADQLALFNAVKAVNMEAWNDDVFDHVFAQIKNLRENKLNDPNDVEEKKKAEAMADLAGAMGWDSATTDPTTGKPDYKKIKATYGRKMSSQLQNIAIFGDARAAKMHNLAEDQMVTWSKSTNQDEKNKAKDYEAALREVESKAGKSFTDLGMSVDSYLKMISDSQDFAQTAAREFTKEAFATKHHESAHNQQYDTKLRMIRPQTVDEAEEETTADLNKMTAADLAKAQIHSYGEMDMNEGHMLKSISERMYRGILGQIEEEYQMNNVPLRSAKKLFGFANDEDVRKDVQGDVVYAQLGGKVMDNAVDAGKMGDNERGAHMIRDYVVPQLLGNHKAFMYGLKRVFGNINLEQGNQGILNLNIDGDKFGKIENIDKLIEAINRDSKLQSDIGAENIKRLQDLSGQAKTAADGRKGNGLGLVEKNRQQQPRGGGTSPGQAASGGP